MSSSNCPRETKISLESSSSQTHVKPHIESSVPTAIGHSLDQKLVPSPDKQSEQGNSGPGTAEHAKDDWDHDPDNARNWPKAKKWLMVWIVSFYTFIPPLASSMMAPGLPEIAERYHIVDPTITALTLSSFLISFAIGPLILAPLSEMYGRTWVLHIGNIFSLAFNLGCAFAPSTQVLIVMRVLTGFAGSAPLACGGGSVADLFSVEERASAMSLYTLGPLMAPSLGPVAGGFLAQTVGVKYVFIVIAATSGLASLLGIPFLRETYAPILRARKAKCLGDIEKSDKQDDSPVIKTGKLEYVWQNLTRPVILLTRSFICFILSLYMAFMYGVYYLMFATFPDFFHKTYGFESGIGGLLYIGLGLGFVGATLFCAQWADAIYQRLTERNGGIGKPEYRIPSLFAGSVMVPIGLLWYGWSAQAKLHWIMPVIGTAIFGFGMMGTYLPMTLYLVDAYVYAASALAAAFVFRSLLGFAFPLFAPAMFARTGMGLGNTLLAGLTVILGIPFPIWIYYHGESMRKRSSFTK